jgi:hypothetical protein
MIEVRQTEIYARWIAGLDDDRARARIEVRIYRLSLGNPGDIRPVGEGVSEMRITTAPAIGSIWRNAAKPWWSCSAAVTSGHRAGTSQPRRPWRAN